MSFLKRAIRNGIRQGVSDAVGKAVQKAVEPTATELANRAANRIDNAARTTVRQSEQVSAMEGAFANLERAAQGYATQMSKNMKVCPSCEQPTSADKKFCPNCGTKLPEQTLADGAVCSACGKQNPIGTKFCQDCGTKLPMAIQQEQAAQAKQAEVMRQWEEVLPQYPKWSCGGSDYNLENYDGNYMFSARFPDNFTARNAVAQYRQVVQASGFRPAGQYPSQEMLYNKIGGICYCVDTEHCFEGDSDCPTVYFYVREPVGGFEYVKPEPKKQVKLGDFFKF